MDIIFMVGGTLLSRNPCVHAEAARQECRACLYICPPFIAPISNSMYTLPICNVEGSTAIECVPIGGYTIGENNLDAMVLDPTFDRTEYSGDSPEAKRYDQIMAAIDGYSRAHAALIAHELGHAMGVAIGGQGGRFGASPYHSYPPYFAFGGNTASFPTSTVGHVVLISYEPYGYFPGAAASIMDNLWIGGYEEAIDNGSSFTSYDKAYLLQKTFYLEDDWPHAGCSEVWDSGACEDRENAYCFKDTSQFRSACIDQCYAK